MKEWIASPKKPFVEFDKKIDALSSLTSKRPMHFVFRGKQFFVFKEIAEIGFLKRSRSWFSYAAHVLFQIEKHVRLVLSNPV